MKVQIVTDWGFLKNFYNKATANICGQNSRIFTVIAKKKTFKQEC